MQLNIMQKNNLQLWSCQGVLHRLAFFLTMSLYAFLYIIFLKEVQHVHLLRINMLEFFFFLDVHVLFLVGIAFATIKRLRGIEKDIAWFWWIFVPGIQVFFFVYLLGKSSQVSKF